MKYCGMCGNKLVNGVCPECGFSVDQLKSLIDDATEVEKADVSGKSLFDEGMKYLNKDNKEAFKYFLRAAEMKYVPAYLQLADMFRGGIGVRIDKRIADNCLRMAAESGDPKGCLQYANTFLKPYILGEGIPRFYEFESWAKKAAENGSWQACSSLGKYFADRHMDESKEWYRKAIEIMEPLAKSGDIDVQLSLGMIYAWDRTGEEAFDKALYWFKEAEKIDYERAQYNIGYLYWNGIAVDKDLEESIRRYEISAEAGNSSSMTMLYLHNRTLDRYEEVYKWARRLAEAGDSYAAGELEACYRLGRGVEKDLERSKFWDPIR